MQVGQMQLLRRQIAHQLHTSCKFNSKFLATALNTMNECVLTEFVDLSLASIVSEWLIISSVYQCWIVVVKFHWGHPQHTHTHTHPFNGPFSEATRVSWYQKGKTSLDFTKTRDSEWQWHQVGHIQVCNSLQHPTTQFLPAGCPSCRPTNIVKALKAYE